MAIDASLKGWRFSYGRGSSSSVILPRTMMADTNDNLIGCMAAKLLATPCCWLKTKERMRRHLEHLTRNHSYVDA